MKNKITLEELLAKTVAILLTAILVCPAQAKEKEDKAKVSTLGISTDFGDVLIENLGIGRTYNLREIAGTPFKVKNNGTEVVNLKIDVVKPHPGLIFSKRLEMGVKPIPSVSWVRVAQDEFLLPPGETAFTDIIITIPDDPSLYGKKFQASIHSKTVGKNFLQTGVWSHLIITITPSPEAQAEMEKNRKRGLQKTADFSLLPDKLYLTGVPIGRPYDVRKENKRTIKLANIGENPVVLSVESVTIINSPVSLQAGFEAGDPSWLKSKSNEFKLDTDSVEDPGWVIDLPKDKSLKGKKIMFVFRVKPAESDVTGFTFYGRIYVEVEK